MKKANFAIGKPVSLEIYQSNKLIYSADIVFSKTFSDVNIGQPVKPGYDIKIKPTIK